MPQCADALALLAGFDPGPDPRAQQSLRLTERLLQSSPDPFSRTQFAPGHVTASGVVLWGEPPQVLLIFHRRLQRWLQPGGHVEPSDPDLVATARREILEETGVRLDAGCPPVLVGVDVHPIPAARREPAHLHYDLVFRFRASGDGRLIPENGRRVRWCAPGRLDQYGADRALLASVSRALAAGDPGS